MTYDLWEVTVNGEEFIGIFTSLTTVIEAGNIKHKALDKMPRASIYIEWVDDKVDYSIRRYSDSEDWILKNGAI